MKQLLSLFLAIILTLCLCACQPQEPERGDQIDSGKAFSLGVTDGIAYESSFIGLGFQLPEGWNFYSDEQIREINDQTADIAGEEYLKAMENATVFYDVFAIDSLGNSININLEKVNAAQLLLLDLESNYVSAFDMIKASYENMGCEGCEYAIDSVSIDGKDFPCLNITADFSGVSLHQCIITVKCNGYLANISITVVGENTISQLVDNFYLL